MELPSMELLLELMFLEVVAEEEGEVEDSKADEAEEEEAFEVDAIVAMMEVSDVVVEVEEAEEVSPEVAMAMAEEEVMIQVLEVTEVDHPWDREMNGGEPVKSSFLLSTQLSPNVHGGLFEVFLLFRVVLIGVFMSNDLNLHCKIDIISFCFTDCIYNI